MSHWAEPSAGDLINAPKTDLPELSTDALDTLFAQSFPRKRNIRTALLVGTALAAAVVVADVVVSGSPALAACPTGTRTYTGNFPNGITCDYQPADTTIVTTGTTNIGDNFRGNGIDLTAGANDLTLGVTTSSATVIGPPYSKTATNDGIFVFSNTNYSGTAIVIDNAATIGAVGNNGIEASISDIIGEYSPDTITITNSGPIGSAANPVGHNGIYASILLRSHYATANASVAITNNSGGTIYSNAFGIRGDVHVDNYGRTAIASVTINNSAPITSYSRGAIFGSADAYADLTVSNGSNATGGYASATVTITNNGPVRTAGLGNRFGAAGRSSASADATAYGAGIASAGTAVASTVISNYGPLMPVGFGVLGQASAGAVGYSHDSTGTSFGGSATAGVIVSNSGSVTAHYNAVSSFANARAGAYGSDRRHRSYNAYGGIAFATTTLANSAPVAGLGTSAAVFGGASAYAEALGYNSAVGGTAIAEATISNSGAITSNGSALTGGSNASADAGAHVYVGVSTRFLPAFTAQGGLASATTTITNYGTITSGRGGILSSVLVYADGVGSNTSLFRDALMPTPPGVVMVAALLMERSTTGPALAALHTPLCRSTIKPVALSGAA